MVLDAWNLPRFNPRTPSEGVARALKEADHESRNWYRLCAKFCAYDYGWDGSGELTAHTLWTSQTKETRHGPSHDAPIGALYYWNTSGSADHVAIVVARGKVASNDIKSAGKIDVVEIGYITQKWNCAEVGWSLPYFPKGWGAQGPLKVIKKPTVTQKVSLSAVQKAYGNYVSGSGSRSHPDVLDVRNMLVKDGFTPKGDDNDIVGAGKHAQYLSYQKAYCKKHGIPVNSTTCDGVPGSKSLGELCKKHGFTMVA